MGDQSAYLWISQATRERILIDAEEFAHRKQQCRQRSLVEDNRLIAFALAPHLDLSHQAGNAGSCLAN